MEYKFREATTDDIPGLLQFEQGIIAAERPYYQFLRKENVTYYNFPELIADSDSYLIVVEFENRIVGSGYAQQRSSRPCFEHNNHCYLGFIYLERELRGKGLGARVIEELKEWGLSRGLSHFQLNVYAENKSAIRAYEKAGFSKVTALMELVV